MKRSIALPAALCAALLAAAPASAEQEKPPEYVHLVMGTFRNHLLALEMLTAAPSEHSDNVVRHAHAISHTSGLLDHAFSSNVNHAGATWPWKTEAEFDKLLLANKAATKGLVTAAETWLRDHDRARFMVALDGVKTTCRACHGDAKAWP